MKTLLDNLCMVAGVQGGTIHHYCDLLEDNYYRFKALWNDRVTQNGFLYSKEHFISLASQADYEGLIWRPRKLSETYLSTLNPEAIESYYKSRSGN